MLCDKYREYLHWTVYQIYPRSFMDSDGDGVGDIRGILRKLDYLQALGVNALWLCPVYKSPNDDNGYDISDYRDIREDFGTLQDLDDLIAALHQRGMKLIMDLVPNHTSTAHPWFRESRKGREGPYSDYYYWFDEPPNDWQSVFRGSAWEFDPVRGQYYLHSFAVSQADLNWENPRVRQEMADIVDFWTARGVDGFRVDVIDLISKDLQKTRGTFGPRLHEYIRWLFGRENVPKLFTVGESGVNDMEELIRHCAAERKELTTLFLFDHMKCGRADKFTPKPDSLKTLRDRLVYWQEAAEKYDLILTLFTDNHDQAPMISRIADDGEKRYESAAALAVMTYLLRGVPFIYQGQEIGTVSPRYDSIDDFDDVETLNAYREFLGTMTPEQALEKINFGSRDNARRPIAWDSGKNFGFTAGTPWIPCHSRAGEINAEKDLKAEKSVYRFYQALLKLRASHEAFITGITRVLSSPEDDFFVFTRAAGNETWVAAVNFANEQKIDVGLDCAAPALASLGRKTISGVYAPYECAVARVVANVKAMGQ